MVASYQTAPDSVGPGTAPGTLVAVSSPEKLTEQVEAAARGEAGPTEGDKPQTWRALRKHGPELAAAAQRNGVAPGERVLG